MQPWYKLVRPREEVREGRSFNPDEFAIHLEQVVGGTAPEDYRDPAQFFARTSFTRALREHSGMVLRRLAGKTANTPPVMTLITQFGGGKTHTLTALYHLATAGKKLAKIKGVAELLKAEKLSEVPGAKVAVFVGNAWDPREGSETPWIDIARQLAGEQGVAELGADAKNTPPGTATLQRVFAAANTPVLVLFDEVLNCINRHRMIADQFHAFIQNLSVAMTATTHSVAVMSLPRSQMEMGEFENAWQTKITKVVRRVTRDLFVNDETEVGEVVRCRLFDDYGTEKARRKIANTYADWCFERRDLLPAEWTAVDSAATESKAREFLRERFESCYPFHPATLSVFQRKWQVLPQYQQTRGTLAMLAQWVCHAYQTGFTKAEPEPLIMLGSAPLESSAFHSVVLGQLGESRLEAAIHADIAGPLSHARALDADAKGKLRDIHRRVGTVILFESSGGQVEKVAHIPELYFALGEPNLDTASIHSAALELEKSSYFVRRVGPDGFKISHQPTLRKVVNDRRAALDDAREIEPAVRDLVKGEFGRGASMPVVYFPEDSSSVPDVPKLTLVVADPAAEWENGGDVRKRISEATAKCGNSPRTYPNALVWCVKKPGNELRGKVGMLLAWQRVADDVASGVLGGEFDRTDKANLKGDVNDAKDAAKDEVWADYRFVVIADKNELDGLKAIDLGVGHSSAGQTLCGRVEAVLRMNEALSESVGAGYIRRHWPPALEKSGAWPLKSLRQSFLDGSLTTRLSDPDATLRGKIPEFVVHGEFGLASGKESGGGYQRVWFSEHLSPEEIFFEADVFLLTKETAKALKAADGAANELLPEQSVQDDGAAAAAYADAKEHETPGATGEPQLLRISGPIPSEAWNRIGTTLLPKLRGGKNLTIDAEFCVEVDGRQAAGLRKDVEKVLDELGLKGVSVRLGSRT